MNDKEIAGKVHNAMYHQCKARGFTAPIDVLIDIGVLPKKKAEDWRFGRIPYLEAACTVNLKKLSAIMAEVRAYARKNNLNPSFCYYKQWGNKKKTGQGHKPVAPLRFSKSGDTKIERSYATHYVDSAQIAALKEEKSKENE